MAEITLLVLDQAAAESLAGDPAGFARRHGLVLAPHEHTAVAIATDTARFLAGGGARAREGGLPARGHRDRSGGRACLALGAVCPGRRRV
jgi:hypothetical protein